MAKEEQSGQEVDMNPEQRAEYRQMLAVSLQHARKYKGDETSFNQLINAGDRLDQWMRSTFGANRMLDPTTELQIAEKAGVTRVGTIDDILDIASRNLRETMEKPKTLAEKLEKLSIVHSTIDGVLLPPGTQEIAHGDGNGEWKEARTEPRIERLLAALQEHGIFTDDLIVTLGITKENMMRKESYALIEIPRIGREVLVCNQVGEATFVSRRHFGLPTYLQKTKEEIGELEGIERIVSPGLGEWEIRVIEALLKDISAGETKKINVKNMDAIRRAIIERYPTGKEWMEMTGKQKDEFKIMGRGERAIATALGLQSIRNPCSYLYEHALLGQAIYGDAAEINKVLDNEREWLELEEKPEKLKQAVRAKCPTAKEWMEMTGKQKDEFKIAERSERAIATALGLQSIRNPCSYFYEHALLGQAIYGDAAEINKVLDNEREWLELEEKPEKLREVVRAKCPTAKEWMEMTGKQKNEFKVTGRGERAIAKAFGFQLKKDPCSSSYEHALLGQVIYGDAAEIMDVLRHAAIIDTQLSEQEWLELQEKPEKLKQVVHSRCPTAKEWMEMTGNQKDEFKIMGRGEKAIATLLGLKLEKDPCSYSYEHALLGQAIYGDTTEISKILDGEKQWLELQEKHEKVKEAIQKKCPTAKEWIEMTVKQKNDFKIAGRGEVAIAIALGLELKRNPCNSSNAHALLGKAIYGDTAEINEVLDGEKQWLEIQEELEKLKQAVRAKCPTAKDWMEMTAKQKHRFKIAGRGEMAIANILGLKLENDSCSYSYEHALIGQAIYGNQPEIMEALKKYQPSSKEE